jgi:hypothetical protein
MDSLLSVSARRKTRKMPRGMQRYTPFISDAEKVVLKKLLLF